MTTRADLPVGWLPTTLGELGKWSSGGTPNRGFPEYYGGEIPWVKTGDLTDGLITSIPETITELGFSKSSAKLFPSGTLLIAMYGATIGKLGLLANAATTNQACAALLPEGTTKEVIPYLFWFLKERRDDLRAVGQGGAQPNISQTVLKEYPCPLPPLNEQRRIVAKIEDLTAHSRAAKQALDAIPPLLERFRQSVLAAAFRGDLTKQWREQNPNVEPASELLKRIRQERRHRWEQDYLVQQKAKGKTPKDDKWKEKYQEPEPVDTTGLPDLPPGWCWASVDQLSIVVRGASPRPAGSPEYFGGEIPWITVGSLTAGDTPYLESTKETLTEKGRAASRFVEPGTLLLTNSGATLGVPRIIKIGGCINDGSVALLHLIDDLKLFIYYFLKSQTARLRAMNQGAAQPNLNTTIVKEILVPIPPLSEASYVTRMLESMLSSARTASDSGRVLLEMLNSLNQSILAKAFSGELVPQDPNDEPASALLERIRSEQEAARIAETNKKQK